MQINLLPQRAYQWFSGNEGYWEGWEGQEETFGGDGCAHYLGGGDGFTCVYICRNL